MASPRHTHHSPYSSTFDPERYYSSGTNACQQQQQQQRQRSNSVTGHHSHGHGHGHGHGHPRSPLPAGSVLEHTRSASSIHFAFERQPSAASSHRGSAHSPLSLGGASPYLHSPAYYTRGHSHSLGGYGDLLAADGGATTLGGECGAHGHAEYRPAVPVPLLSGSGPQGIPDFLTLTDEANERAGGLQPLRAGPVLTWDDVSAQLERPKGVPLVEDADGAAALVLVPAAGGGGGRGGVGGEEEEEDEGAAGAEGGVGAKARELMGLWTMGTQRPRVPPAAAAAGRRRPRREEEAVEAEEEDGGAMLESWAAAETDGETMPDYDEEEEEAEDDDDDAATRMSEAGAEAAAVGGASMDVGGAAPSLLVAVAASSEGDGGLPRAVAAAVGGRFHPLGQLEWERGIQWGGGQEEEEDEEDEDEDADDAMDEEDAAGAGAEAPEPPQGGQPQQQQQQQQEEEMEAEDEEEAEEGEMEDPRVVLERRRADEARRRQRARRLAAKARAAAAAAAAAAGGGAGDGGASREGVDPAVRAAARLEEETERVLRAPFPLNAELGSLRWTQAILWGGGGGAPSIIPRPPWSSASASSSSALVPRRAPRPPPPRLPLGRLILDRNDVGIFLEAPPLPRIDLARLGLLAPGQAAAAAAAEAAAAARTGAGAGGLFGLGRRAALAIPALEHAECAVKHETTVADPTRICLGPEELRHFHRPRFPRVADIRWALRPPKEKGEGAGGAGGGGGARARGRTGTKTIRSTKDLGAHEGEIILIEYAEERPPLLSNPGMAAKLLNLWRLSKEDLKAEQELARDKAREFGGGGGDGAGAAASVGPPRISRETLGAPAVAMDLDRAHAGVPDFPQGQTVVLDPDEPSPFLGQIEDQMRQIALFSNLFRAPLFEHQARPTDFLLVRASAVKVRNPPTGAAAGETECFALREIPRVYLCGQQEPQMVVPDPDEPRCKDLRERLVRLALVMQLSGGGGGAAGGARSVDVIDCVRLFDTLCELLSDKPDKEEAEKEQKAIVNANLRRVGQPLDDRFWALGASVNTDEVLREVSPEEVCLYESMCAGVRRLLDEGINLVGKVGSFDASRIQPILASNLQSLLRDRQARAERMRRAADIARGTPRAVEAEEVAGRMKALYEEVREIIAVGAFLLDEVQLAPWALSKFYHAIKHEKQFGGMFKLSGLGDPSGRGEGFSFLPRHQQGGRPFKEVLAALDPSLQAIIGDATLFRMGVATMNQLLKHIWSVPAMRRAAQHRLSTAGYETELDELMRLVRKPKKRRVEVILGVEGDENEPLRTGAGVQEYRNTCDRIWNKQVNALSDPSGQFGEEEALLDELDLDEGGGGAQAQAQGQARGGGAGAGAAEGGVGGGEAGTQQQGGGGGGGEAETEEDAAAVQRELAERAAALAEQRQEAEVRRQQEALMMGVALPAWQRPKQVVKRLVKEVDQEGNERYRVEFLFGAEEVARVQRERAAKLEELRKQQRRAMKMAAAAVGGAGAGAAGGLGAGGEGGGQGGVGPLVLSTKGRKRKGSQQQKLSITQLKQRQQEHQEQERRKKKAKSDQEKALYERTYAAVPGRRGSAAGGEGAGGGGGRTTRPSRELTVHLDPIYSRLEELPAAKPFKRLKAKSMDMERIHKKKKNFLYESRQEFLDDIATIVAEAEAGGDPTLAQYARIVQQEAVQGVLALDNAELARLEVEVAAKNSLKKKRKQEREAKKQQQQQQQQQQAGKASAGAGGGGGAGGLWQPQAPAPMQIGVTGAEAGFSLGGPQPPTGLIGMDAPLIFPGDDGGAAAAATGGGGGGGVGGGGGGDAAGQPFITFAGDAGEDSSSGEEEVLQIDQL